MTGVVSGTVVGEGQSAAQPLLSARGVEKAFPVRSTVLRRTVGHVRAVDGVDLDVYPGETVSLVGESGCGKSTFARTLLRLVEPTAGTIDFEGVDLAKLDARTLRRLRVDMQMIFQDPVGSLDPRMTVEQIVEEGLRAHGHGNRRERRELVVRALEDVGLDEGAMGRHPHQFSGGQRQRIGIARALVLRPRLVIADEPVSALDVSVQAQVLNLLVDLKRRLSLTYLFIAHNLAVVDYISDRIGVMYLGKIVELSTADEIRTRPLHPYTVALLSAVPPPEPGAAHDRIVLKGDVPSPMNMPSGCRFRSRCPIAQDICAQQQPPLTETVTGHAVACHLPGQMG